MTQPLLYPQADKKYRLITRSDMDGLVCAALLKELDMIDEVKFVHPKDMQDGLIEVSDRDITTNVPYVPGVFMAFDHHASELNRIGELPKNYIADVKAPSAARVVYEYFGGDAKFPGVQKDLMDAVDKADSANFSRDDILNPKGWDLLSFIMDARTGLGRFQNFRIPNFKLMENLIDYCQQHMTVTEILQLPDIKERVELYDLHKLKARQQIERCSKLYKNLVVLDLRFEDRIWATNRFSIYALFPQCNISIHTMWGKGNQNTVFATGKSILNRTSKTSVGDLMLQYGGGGHEAAGTCQIDNEHADEVLEELIARINADG